MLTEIHQNAIFLAKIPEYAIWLAEMSQCRIDQIGVLVQIAFLAEIAQNAMLLKNTIFETVVFFRKQIQFLLKIPFLAKMVENAILLKNTIFETVVFFRKKFAFLVKIPFFAKMVQNAILLKNAIFETVVFYRKKFCESFPPPEGCLSAGGRQKE